MRTIGLVVVLSCGGCGDDRLRVEGNEVRGPGFSMTIPEGFTRQPPPQSPQRVVLLAGPSGQFEAPTIRHSDAGPTQPLNRDECERAAISRQKTATVAARVGVRASTVGPVSTSDAGLLGPVCAFVAEDRARASAVRLFNLRHHGYRVTCEADEASEAVAICDAYLASASKPGRPR